MAAIKYFKKHQVVTGFRDITYKGAPAGNTSGFT